MGLDNGDKLNSSGGFFARITGAIDGDLKLEGRQFDR